MLAAVAVVSPTPTPSFTYPTPSFFETLVGYLPLAFFVSFSLVLFLGAGYLIYKNVEPKWLKYLMLVLACVAVLSYLIVAVVPYFLQ